MNLEIRNLIDRSTFEALIERLGGVPLSEHEQQRRAARRALEGLLSGDQRPVFNLYSDAVTDSAGVREDAATRAGLALGVGVGVALHAWPDRDVGALATFAAELVAGVLGADVGATVAQDLAEQVLRVLARLSVEPVAR